MEEIQALKTLTHEHLVSLRDQTFEPWGVTVYYDYCEGGDLKTKILKGGRFSESEVWKMLM